MNIKYYKFVIVMIVSCLRKTKMVECKIHHKVKAPIQSDTTSNSMSYFGENEFHSTWGHYIYPQSYLKDQQECL